MTQSQRSHVKILTSNCTVAVTAFVNYGHLKKKNWLKLFHADFQGTLEQGQRPQSTDSLTFPVNEEQLSKQLNSHRDV